MPAVKDTDISSLFLENVVRFLVKLQTSGSEEEDVQEETVHPLSSSTSTFPVLGASVDPLQTSTPNLPEGPFPLSSLSTISLEETKDAGFSGRCNKIADTCYSFWVGGTLAVRTLQRSHFFPSFSVIPDPFSAFYV